MRQKMIYYAKTCLELMNLPTLYFCNFTQREEEVQIFWKRRAALLSAITQPFPFCAQLSEWLTEKYNEVDTRWFLSYGYVQQRAI